MTNTSKWEHIKEPVKLGAAAEIACLKDEPAYPSRLRSVGRFRLCWDFSNRSVPVHRDTFLPAEVFDTQAGNC